MTSRRATREAVTLTPSELVETIIDEVSPYAILTSRASSLIVKALESHSIKTILEIAPIHLGYDLQLENMTPAEKERLFQHELHHAVITGLNLEETVSKLAELVQK